MNQTSEPNAADKVLSLIERLSRLTCEHCSPEELIRRIINEVPAIVKIDRLSLMLIHREGLSTPASIGLPTQYTLISSLDQAPVIKWVVEHKASLNIDNTDEDPRCNELGLKSDRYSSGAFISIPLIDQNKVIGVLNLTDRLDKGIFSSDEVRTLEVFTGYLAFALSNSLLKKKLEASRRKLKHRIEELRKHDRLKEEMTIARMIQQQFLPLVMPEFPGIEVAAMLTSAEEIGGDFYNFIERDDGRFAIFIGDVSGKGIPAALTMILATSHMGEIARSASNPEVFMKCAHRLLCHYSQGHQYVTTAMLTIDPGCQSMEYCLAGHLPIMHYRAATRDIVELTEGGMPIGMYQEYDDYPFQCVKLEAGDRLLLYTDGVIDARNRLNKAFGAGTLKKLLIESGTKNVNCIVDEIRKAIANHTAGVNLFDDTTLIGLAIG
ncbi:MAG: SpoIIE family protein phosphatase [Candidatus Riflebacteria bacterium]|nr:SpoIIE family protein phosphatase [Candidatus Riflebacteria bacterium]